MLNPHREGKKPHRNFLEDALCIAFTEHCHTYFPQQPGVLAWTHIPLQGRSAQQGKKLKSMGVHAGWFDYQFMGMYDKFIMLFLEAKTGDYDYGKSQRTFDYMTRGFPIIKDKFYSVKEGHEKIIAAGIKPIKPCTLFKEPAYLSKQEKFAVAFDMYTPEHMVPRYDDDK